MSDDEFLHAIEEHHDVVAALARRLSRSHHQAEDLMQETYLRALLGWRQRRSIDARAWLITICLNTARTSYRRAQARPIEVMDLDAGKATVSAFDTAAEALAMVVQDTVRRALRQLPAAQREAIVLMNLCGLSAAQVAALTGVPEAPF